MLLKTQTKASPELEVHPNQTVVSNVDFFKVVDPNTGQPVFSTERSAFVLSKAVKKFAAHDVETNKVLLLETILLVSVVSF